MAIGITAIRSGVGTWRTFALERNETVTAPALPAEELDRFAQLFDVFDRIARRVDGGRK
jgi:hypothetical protein